MALQGTGPGIARYPASVIGCTALVLLTAFFWATGALFPDELPRFARSSLQATGMSIMLIVLPAYILAAGILVQRRSLGLVEELRPQLPAPHFADAAARTIREGLAKTWGRGCVAGFVLGLFNTDFVHAFTTTAVPAIEISFTLGQILLWVMVGMSGGMRFAAAGAFKRLGEVVDFDLFQLQRLRPLAHSGLIDVVSYAGALALIPLQSLDAEFRWYNYQFALLVVIPAAIFVVIWPLRSIHRRILSQKQHLLAEVEAAISEVGPARSEAQILRLESLLSHRDRIREERSWPIDTPLLSRFALYVVIPPLAWVGAALVEMVVARLVSG